MVNGRSLWSLGGILFKSLFAVSTIETFFKLFRILPLCCNYSKKVALGSSVTPRIESAFLHFFFLVYPLYLAKREYLDKQSFVENPTFPLKQPICSISLQINFSLIEIY